MSVRLALATAALGLSFAAFAADSNTTVPTKRPPDPEVAQTLWMQSCSSCHGPKGLGDGPLAAALGGVESLDGRISADTMDDMNGVVRNGKGKMPAFSETIDAGDTRRVLEWIRDVSAGKLQPKPPRVGPPPNRALPADKAVPAPQPPPADEE